MPQPFSLTGGNMKYSGVGGQAVMEGVMMKNEDRYAVAVRKPDHTIDVKVSTFKETIKNKKLRRLPFIRGVINFIESLILGMQTLMYSASFFEDDEDEKKKKEAMTQEERKAQEEKEKKQEKAMMGGTVAFSVVFALGLFFFLPYFLSGIFHKVISSDTVIALLEGLIRLAIFIGYIALISLTPDIKRVFMYHGAEHKCINCIEHGKCPEKFPAAQALRYQFPADCNADIYRVLFVYPCGFAYFAAGAQTSSYSGDRRSIL